MEAGSPKNWAVAWKTTQPPAREAHEDAFWAQFEDSSGNFVRVRITAQELRSFGRGASTKAILRAILETYVEKHGAPQGEIEPNDLGEGLQGLKEAFRK